MLTALAIGTVPAVVMAVVAWFLSRREREATLFEKLATSALERMDRAEKRLDSVEGKLDTLREEIHPHRLWDDAAHRKVLETDPHYPPPPPLSI